MSDQTKFNLKALAVVMAIVIILYVFLGIGRNDAATQQPQDGSAPATEVQSQ